MTSCVGSATIFQNRSFALAVLGMRIWSGVLLARLVFRTNKCKDVFVFSHCFLVLWCPYMF